jgi:diacylglycerol kinase family enzyme
MTDAPKPAARPGRPLVVANPMASGLADADRRRRMVASIVSAVERRTGRTPVVADSTAENARAALEQARDAELVVVAGGDGTIRDTAEHLIGSGVPMAIVPAGTANVFGAELGVPRGIKGAIDLIATGRPTSVDVGRATWGAMTDRGPGEPMGCRAFVVACGLGFDARVMAGATPELKRQLGFGAYVVSAARQAARLRPVDFRIEADGVLHEIRGLIVLLANCGQIVPRLVGPRRPIDPTDGFLEVIVIRASGRTGGIVGLAEVLVHDADPHLRRRSVRLRARSVRVTADPPEPAQVDGDHHEADWLAAECVPAGLRVIRP